RRPCPVGFAPVLFGLRNFLRDPPRAFADGAADARHHEAPEESEQQRKGDRKPEHLAWIGRRIERRKAPLTSRGLGGSGLERHRLHQVKRMISAMTRPNRPVAS